MSVAEDVYSIWCLWTIIPDISQMFVISDLHTGGYIFYVLDYLCHLRYMYFVVFRFENCISCPVSDLYIGMFEQIGDFLMRGL